MNKRPFCLKDSVLHFILAEIMTGSTNNCHVEKKKSHIKYFFFLSKVIFKEAKYKKDCFTFSKYWCYLECNFRSCKHIHLWINYNIQFEHNYTGGICKFIKQIQMKYNLLNGKYNIKAKFLSFKGNFAFKRFPLWRYFILKYSLLISILDINLHILTI